MLITVLDIETTGLFKFDANNMLVPDILEVAYAFVDTDSMLIHKHGVLYFYRPEFDVESEAQQIHGLTRDFLRQYEDQFDDNLIALAAMMTNATILGKNSTRFDIPFIDRFIEKYMGRSYDITKIVSDAKMKNYEKTSTIFHADDVQSIDLQELYAPIYRLKNYYNKFGRLNDLIEGRIPKSDWSGLTFDQRKRGKLHEYVDLTPGARELIDSVYAGLDKSRETREHGALYDVVMTYVMYLYYLQEVGSLT